MTSETESTSVLTLRSRVLKSNFFAHSGIVFILHQTTYNRNNQFHATILLYHAAVKQNQINISHLELDENRLWQHFVEIETLNCQARLNEHANTTSCLNRRFAATKTEPEFIYIGFLQIICKKCIVWCNIITNYKYVRKHQWKFSPDLDTIKFDYPSTFLSDIGDNEWKKRKLISKSVAGGPQPPALAE